MADSFRLRVRVTVADTGTAPTRLFVKQSIPQSEDQIGLLIHRFTPGTTTDTVFTAYVVRPGTYDLLVYTVTQGPASRVFSPPYPVAVTQSDVTPPVIVPISPLDGETVGESSVPIVWDASDNRVLCKYGLEMYGDDPMRSCGMSGGFPHPTALSSAVRRVSVDGCALQRGLNRVTINVTDRAGNTAMRTVMVRSVRAVQGTRASP